MGDFVKKYLFQYADRELKIADIGSQDVNGSYYPLFSNPKWKYFGCDIAEGKNVDIVLEDVYDWKSIRSNTFDVIVSGQAFEHIEYFWVTMMEISRVMKYGAICCILAPSGGYEHQYPVDCWRFYPDGFKALSKYAGLEVVEVLTDWNPIQYADGGEIWKDSILVCKKPVMSNSRKLKLYLKNRLSKVIVKIRLD
jgi:SAM-dependent methyltransferase